jgi:hypothetical protein
MTGTGESGTSRPGRWRPSTPATVLVLLAPAIGEVLNGATRISYIFAFIPQIMVWGCGTLLIREAVQRWRGGWASILALALAMSVAVEFLILQTSVAPIPWLVMMSIPVYDRIWGVNWLWFVFMLGYEAVWIVLVPILITELIFPARRDELWLRARGLRLAAIAFTLGSLMLWALWTQITVPIVFKVAKYQPPHATLLVGVLAILVLILIAYLLRNSLPRAGLRMAGGPGPWLVGLAAMVLGFPWWLPIVLVFAPRPSVPLWLPLVGAAVWASAALFVVERWSRGDEWNDRHRWALAFGALLVCMLAGFLGSTFWPWIDLAGKIVLNVIAIVLMISLARVIWRRTAATDG